MKKMIYNDLARTEYKEDCEILQTQLRKRGYDVDLSSISFAWECHSGNHCAGWLCLSRNEEKNVENILNYLVEVEK